MWLKKLFVRAKAADAAEPATPNAEPERSPQEIEDLIRSLKTQDPDTRRGAQVCLGDPGVADAFVAPLLAATQDEDPYIRASAVYAFARYDMKRHSQAMDAVLRALASDADASVRAAAAHVLESQSPEHVPALVAALADESAEVRWEAVWALGAFGRTEQAIAALKDRLYHDEDAGVRARAAAELGGVKSTALLPDLLRAVNDPDERVRAEVLPALSECDCFENRPELQAVFIAALADASASVREQAANALRFSTPEAVPALMAAVHDEAPRVRMEAVIALGSMRVHEAIDLVADRQLNDPDEQVRFYAASAFGDMQDQRATQPLLDAFADRAEAHRVRWGALWALGDNQDASALPALCAALQDPDAEFRERAADSLAQFPWEDHPENDAVLHSLCAALADGEPGVRKSVCDALASLRYARALPFLDKTLQDDDEAVRSHAVKAIGRIDPKAGAAQIAACLQDPSLQVQEAAAEALWLPEGAAMPPQALAYLLDPDANGRIRGRLAISLTRHDDPAVVPHLIDALALGDAEARAGILEALREQPDPRAMAPLLKLLADTDEGVRSEAALALAAIGDDKAIKPLKSMLKRDPSAYVRRRVVWALSFFSPEAILPELTGAFGDRDPHVQRQAVKALSELCDVSELRFLLSELPKRKQLDNVRQALEETIEELESDESDDDSGWPRRVGMGTLHYE